MIKNSSLKKSLWLSFYSFLFALTTFATPVQAETEFNFAWPNPSRVTVTEKALKKGKRATTRYDIVFKKADEGKYYILKFENFRFLKLDGVDLTTDEAKKQLGAKIEQMNAYGSLIPPFIISSDGTFKDVTGLKEMCDELGKKIDDPGFQKTMDAMMSSPRMVAMIKQNCADFWKVWVETWIGLKVEANKKLNLDRELGTPDGRVMSVPFLIRNEGEVTEAKDHVRLVGESTIEGEKAKAFFSAFFKQLVSQVAPKDGEQKKMPADLFDSIRRTDKMSVVTNPKTLQPLKAGWEKNISIKIKDKTRNRIETHEYTFDWKPKKDEKPKAE